jgi:putative chitinase
MNIEKLKTVISDEVLSQIPETISKFQLNTPLRLAHFLAQCGHESGNWKFKVENLNYSASSLQSVFRKYFPDETTAAQYARKPERIANKVYASRMANGDEASGDGWKFRGRGYIQLTGRQNYTSFNNVVEENIIDNPDLVADKYPLLSAAWFWDANKLNALADKGATDTDVTAITKRVNGGTHGLDDRLSKFKQYYNLLV